MALTAVLALDVKNFEAGLKKAVVELQVFERANKNTNRDLKNLMEGFSGQRVVVEAARMAEAVQRIGGASKLTESEQRRVNATIGEALEKYRALGQEAPAHLARLHAETAKVTGESKHLSAVLSGAVAGAVAAVGTAALSAAQSLGRMAVQGLGQVVTRGGEVAALRGAFERLSGGVTIADDSIRKMRGSTSGLIADFDLMQSSNKAMLLGLNLNNDQMADLAKTAVTLGRAMGQGATKSLDDLIVALGRSSPMILDNLGLSVKVGEANEVYARKLGKTAEQLTDTEKKQAFMTAAMEAARSKVEQLGDVQITLNERLQQGAVWFGNIFDKVSDGIVRSDVLAAGLTSIGTALMEAFGGDQDALIRTVVSSVEQLAILTIKAAEEAVRYAQVGAQAFGAVMAPIRAVAVAILSVGEAYHKLVASAAELASKLPGAGSALAGIGAAATKSAESFEAARKNGQAMLTASLDLARGQGPVHEALDKTREALAAAATNMERVAAEGPKAGAGGHAAAAGIGDAGDSAGKADEKLKKFLQSLRELGGIEAMAGAQEVVKQLAALDGPLNVLPSKLEAMAVALRHGAEAALLQGKTKLAAEFEMLARTLKPVTMLQQRYNVTIGEYVPIADDVVDAVKDQIDVLTKLDETIHIGVLPNVMNLTKAWAPFKAAVESSIPAIQKAAKELDKVEKAAARRETTNALRELSRAFADLAQSTGDTDGPIAKIGELIGLMAVGSQAANNFRDGLEQLRKPGIENVTAGFLSMAAAAAAAGAAMMQATDRAGQANRVMSGAATGAALGSAFGPWGTLIGGVAGAIWGAIRQPEFEKVAKDVGSIWGVNISEGLARSIAAQSKAMFGGNSKLAALFNMDKIIAEAGGLDAGNIDKLTGMLTQLFVEFRKGSITAAQAVEVLDKNFRAFVEAGTDGNGRLSRGLVDIIKLTRELGLESQEVAAYMREQGAAALEGLNAIIGAFSTDLDIFESVATEVKNAQKAIDELNKVAASGRGADWMREMAEAQSKLTSALDKQGAAAEAARGDLELLGQIAVGVYGAAIEAGMSHAEALKAAQPGLQQLAQAYANLGIDINDAGLSALLLQSNLLKNTPQLLAGIDGLSQSFIALSNMGLLNADTFAKMQQAGMAMYTRIQGEVAKLGGSTKDALLPMQKYLHEAAKQAELLEVSLDPFTQMLIDQSKELGLWGEEGEDAGETLQDTMRDLRDVFQELIDTMRGVPSVIETEVRTNYTTNGPANPEQYDPNWRPDYRNPGDPVLMSSPYDTPLALPGSGAIPQSYIGMSGGARRQTINVPVYLEGHQIAMAVVPHIPAALRRRGVPATWP